MIRHLTKGTRAHPMDTAAGAETPAEYDENQYLNLIQDILVHGTMAEGRNGLTKSVFGAAMHFSLDDGKIPLLTTKKVAWKTCLKELLWFMRGSTSNRELQDQGVRIWNDNASREFLDSRGLTHMEEGDLGPVYGHQWRHFNAEYSGCDDDYSGQGVDQLQNIVDCLRDPMRRTSRRMVMSAWNPCQIDQMALPPCHVLCQFNVSDGNKLSCSLYQRSGDVGLGVPFNIASYSMLTHILAAHCDLLAHEFVYVLGNAHIYDDHLPALEEQVRLRPTSDPTIQILRTHEDIGEYTVDDVHIAGYTPLPPIRMVMRK
jgi:thymidylate synthase